MALYKAIDILKLADSKHTAALAFNCADYNMVHSVAVAAETVQKPVICMLHPDHHRIENWITPELFAKLVADVLTVYKNLAAVMAVNAHDDLHQGTFTCAVASD